jgi:hypothetical protein
VPVCFLNLLLERSVVHPEIILESDLAAIKLRIHQNDEAEWVEGAICQSYKYKVVSTIFNDDIYGIEIIYLQERLHVLVNILAMGSLV